MTDRGLSTSDRGLETRQRQDVVTAWRDAIYGGSFTYGIMGNTQGRSPEGKQAFKFWFKSTSALKYLKFKCDTEL